MKRGDKYSKKIRILIDGFNGILALMIFNFLLYLSKVTNIAFIKEMEAAMGYFGLNGLIDLGFTRIQMLIGVFLTFFVSFILGIILANIIRKIKKVKF